MAYQNTQPLGSQVRGGGGGWRALSFVNSLQQTKPTTGNQDAALKGGAGPVTEAEALQFLKQKDQLNSILGLGSNTVSGSLQPYANAYSGYTAGTGTPTAKGSSY